MPPKKQPGKSQQKLEAIFSKLQAHRQMSDKTVSTALKTLNKTENKILRDNEYGTLEVVEERLNELYPPKEQGQYRFWVPPNCGQIEEYSIEATKTTFAKKDLIDAKLAKLEYKVMHCTTEDYCIHIAVEKTWNKKDGDVIKILHQALRKTLPNSEEHAYRCGEGQILINLLKIDLSKKIPSYSQSQFSCVTLYEQCHQQRGAPDDEAGAAAPIGQIDLYIISSANLNHDHDKLYVVRAGDKVQGTIHCEVVGLEFLLAKAVSNGRYALDLATGNIGSKQTSCPACDSNIILFGEKTSSITK